MKMNLPLNPHVKVLSERKMRNRPRMSLNRLCDISDWRGGRFLDILSELRDVPFVHRKSWEYGMSVWGLEKLGCIKEGAEALSVGAGYERTLFYFANKIRRMVATDIYEGGEEGRPEMLTTPWNFSPFEYRHDHLEVLQMDGCDLHFNDNTFDFAFCLSSIEHFGDRNRVVLAMREMQRVVRKGGIVCISTEYILNEATHPEFFSHDELNKYIIESTDLELVEPGIDLSISRFLLDEPIDINHEPHLFVAPHIVLQQDGVLWTSLILFLRKR